jgi:hypothetical protein
VAGTITGTVRVATTAQPLGSIVIDAYDTTGTLRGSATSDQSGTYILALPAGNYRLLAWDAGRFIYATAFDGHAESFETTPLTAVGSNDTVRRDFSLVVGGTMSGTVVRSNGRGASGAAVEVYNLSGTRRAFTTADSEGRYSMLVAPGEYKVIAYDPAGEYSFSFYPGVRTFAEADRLGVAPAATTAIDFRLDIASRLSGVVVDLSTGLPLGGIIVYAYTPAGLQVTSTPTNANGTFFLSVPAGDYRVVAADPARRYANGFYGLGRAFETSPIVTVKAGASQADVQLGLLRGATVSGRVRDSGGLPLANVTAVAYNTDGTAHALTTTKADGAFELFVAPGAYKLGVFDGNLVYAAAFFGGSRDFVSSNAFALASGQSVGGMDFTLQRGGRVSGTVRENGQPRAGITVAAYDAAGVFSGSGVTAADGTFAFVVPPGQYRFVAFDGSLVHAPAYDGGAATFESTVPRLIAAGSSGIVDFALQRGVAIRGTVLTTSGSPISGVSVFAVDGAGNRVSGSTADDGSFAHAVPPGSYKLVAVDPGHRYAVTYWDGVATLGAARWVNVAEPLPAIAFWLDPVLRRRGVRS